MGYAFALLSLQFVSPQLFVDQDLAPGSLTWSTAQLVTCGSWRVTTERRGGPVPTADCCGTNRPPFESQVLEPHCRTLSVYMACLFCVPPKRYILYMLFFFWGGGICGVFESRSAVEYTHSNVMLISLRNMLMEAQRESRRTYKSTHE